MNYWGGGIGVNGPRSWTTREISVAAYQVCLLAILFYFQTVDVDCQGLDCLDPDTGMCVNVVVGVNTSCENHGSGLVSMNILLQYVMITKHLKHHEDKMYPT